MTPQHAHHRCRTSATIATMTQPWTPLHLHWTEPDTSASTPCRFCNNGSTPATTRVHLEDRHGMSICLPCGRQHDPASARLASRLEAQWQALLAHANSDADTYDIPKVLRGIADEFATLNTGDRVVQTHTSESGEGVDTVYTTRPREA